MKMNSVEELIEDIRQGKMIVLMDDEDRENEGDLVMAAAWVKPEDINFMARFARGLICLTLEKERCEQLALPLMVNKNGSQHGTNFTLSIDAAEGISTGISAADRALTIQVAVAKNAQPQALIQPGHIFPLMAMPGGVLNRAGHTEAGCDLARLAGLEPAAVIVEIMNDDGSMARRVDLEKFAQQHQLKIGTIADLIHYRTVHEKTLERVREEILDTEYGEFRCVVFNSRIDSLCHLALIKGDVEKNEAPFVRVHLVDTFRDLLGARIEGRTGWSLEKALRYVSNQASGVVLLLGQEIQVDALSQRVAGFFSGQPAGAHASAHHAYRTIGTGSQILQALGVRKMRLLSSKLKFNALSGFGLEIIEYVESKD